MTVNSSPLLAAPTSDCITERRVLGNNVHRNHLVSGCARTPAIEHLAQRWCQGKGVDFGLWKSISPSELSCPLDLHTGKVARKLGLLKRKQNDSLTVYELDKKLRKMDNQDPVKYDFALFGLGVNEKF